MESDPKDIGLPKLLDKWKDEIQSKNLPVIKITSEEEEVFVKLGLEMEDSTHDMLVKWGKEEATEEDYLNIAFRKALENTLDERSK